MAFGSITKTGRGPEALDYHCRKGFSEAQLRQLEEECQLGPVSKWDNALSRGGVWHDGAGRFSKYLKDGAQVFNHSDPLQDHLKQFARGFDPITGEALVQNAGDTRQTGYDWTASAQKTFSILWAFAPEYRPMLEKMWHNAVRRGNDQLNKYAGKTRCGAQGMNQIGCAYSFAMYTEFTSRPVDIRGNLIPENEIHAAMNEAFSDGTYGDGVFLDMQIHTHDVVANMAACDDGKMRAVNGQHMMAWQAQWIKTVDAELARQLLEVGIQLEYTDKGTWEIAGLTDLIEHFSKRSQQVIGNKKVLGMDPDSKADTPAARALADVAKKMNRAGHGDFTLEACDEHWNTRREIYGRSKDFCSTLIKEGLKQGRIAVPQLSKKDFKAMMDEFMKNNSVVVEAQFRAAATGLFGPRGIDVDVIQNGVTKFLKECVVLGESKSEVPVYSTQEMINLEREMLEIAVKYLHKTGISEQAVENAIEVVYQRKLKENPNAKMTDQQKDAVRYLCNIAAGVVILEGRAGAGKSFTLDAVREVFQAAGYKIEGLALGWAASDVLKSEGKLDSAAAIEGFVRKLKTGEIKLTNRSLILIDEGSLVGSLHMHAILKAVQDAGAKCIIAGDTRQIQSVAAGGSMRIIKAEKLFRTGQGSFELDEVRRQKQQWDRDAGIAISALNPSAAIASYLQAGREDFKPEIVDGRLVDSGRFIIADNRAEALEQLFQKFISYRLANLNNSAVLVAITNKEVDELNQRAFKAMQEAGLIGPSVVIKTMVGKVEKDLEIGEGAIIQFREKSEKVAVINDDGTEGEREVYNRTFGIVEKLEGKGENICLHVRLMDGDKPSDKVIQIRASDFRNGEFSMEHGMCLTASSVQGKTYDAAFIMGGGLDAYNAYVSCTRHRKDLCIAIDKDSLYAHAARNFDADERITRNQFTDLNALDTLAAQWRYESIKETTIDYLDKHHHDTMIAKRLAKDQNPKVSTLILGAECARLESQVKQLEPEKIREAFRVCKIADAAREKFVRIKDFANVDHLKTTIVQAAKDFGNKLHFSGNKQFHEAVAKVLGTQEMRRAIGKIEVTSQKTIKAIKDLFTSKKDPDAIAAKRTNASFREAMAQLPQQQKRAQETTQKPAPERTPEPTPEPPKPTRKRTQGRSM